ncbi:MAG: undecaprenyl-diphosphate phosphatase [Candidatus Bathyarchaeia archaeon]
MNLSQAAILGSIQGLTEWLPISSTGHLRLAEHFFGLNVPILFDVLLHAGTLIVTLSFFHHDIKKILAALAKGNFKTENGNLIPPIIIGTIPTMLIGFFLGGTIDTVFNDLLPIAGAFALCGMVLFISKSAKESKNHISLTEALVIGTVQGLAIVPGLSRSGLTIAMALLLGINRDQAFKFSFLLSIPTIIGALGITLYTQQENLALANIAVSEILLGIAISVAVGYFSLFSLSRIVINRKFHYFAVYCWLLCVALIASSII